MTYDARGRLESVTLDGRYDVYEYDPNGNLTGINGATFGTYDAQDRMVTFTPPGGGPWRLTYTNNGDLSQKLSGTRGVRVRLRPVVEPPERPAHRDGRRGRRLRHRRDEPSHRRRP